MWEVLTAFDHLQENVEQFQMHIDSKYTTRNEVCDCLPIEIALVIVLRECLTLCVLGKKIYIFIEGSIFPYRMFIKINSTSLCRYWNDAQEDYMFQTIPSSTWF